MPTDPSRTAHNTGPSSLGHPSHTGQRVPPQIPTNLPFTGQLGPHPGLPPHLHHVSNGALNPAQPMPFGPMPPRQMPISSHPTPPPQGSAHNRPQNSEPYFMNPPNNFMGHYPFMSSYMFHNQPYYMPHGESSQQQPQHPRPLPSYPSGPRMHPRPGNTPPVVVPKPKKKIMPIVDPDTKEEIKVSKADTSASSRNSSTPAPPISTPIRVEPRPSRPLAVVPDPSDLNSSATNNSVKSVNDVGPTNDDRKPNPTVLKSQPKASQDAADAHRVDNSVSNSSNRLVLSREADTSVGVKSNVSTTDENVPQTQDSTDEPVTPTPQNILVSSSSESVLRQSHDVASPAVPPAAELLQQKELPTTIDSSVSFVTNQSGDSTTNHSPLDTMTHSSLAESSSISSAPVKTIAPNGASEKETTATDELPAVDSASASPGLSESRDESQRSENLQVEDSTETEDATKEEAGPNSSPDASSSLDELEPESSPSESQIVTFAPGQRRVYAPDVLMSLRSSANQKRVAEFKSAMTPSDIFGSSRSGSSGSNRLPSTGSGPLSSDPRGTRAFPSHSSSGFQMPARGAPLSGMIGPGGFYDGSDIRTPRFAPPPVSRTPSARDGDPRGSRVQRPNQRPFDGFMRRGQMPVEAAVQEPPVEKLKRSATGWHRNKEADDEVTSKVKQVRSLLNKLTVEKFDRIFAQIVAIELSSYEVLVGVVEEIFEKTLFEPKFSDMYAELCNRLDHTIQPILNKNVNEQLNFRRILLNNCKEEFVRFANSSKPVESSNSSQNESADATGEGTKLPIVNDVSKVSEDSDLDKEEAELKASKAKRRMLANVRFIGELFLKDLLSETIIHKQCIQKLLQLAMDTKEEDVLEALCKLLSKTGLKLSLNVNASKHIEHYILLLRQMSKDQSVPARIRFMIQDLLEQRDNGWKVRREEAGAKTIAEIHEDIEKEEKAKADAANALRDRRSRGGGSSRHVNTGSNYPPRVSMMMASRPNSTPGMSRTNMTLEKLNNVKTTGLSASTLPQGMRLGPGGRSGVSTSGNAAPALRPNGSHSFGASKYAVLSSMNVPESALMDESSGDVRRTKSSKPSSTTGRPVSEPGSSSAPKVELMDSSLVKLKAKSILEEFWSIADLNEATSCLEEEVKTPNFPAFIEEAVKVSLEAKMENCEKSCRLFSAWTEKKTISAEIFLSVIKKFGPLLEDIEIDFPRVAELFAKIVFELWEVTEFKSIGGGKYGLDWMKTVFDACEEKKTISKFVVRVLQYKYNSLRTMGEEDRRCEVANIYRSLDIDLAAELSAWDDMMGPRTLRSILDRADMLFLVSTLNAELQLRGSVETKPSLDDCVGALKSFDGSLDGQSGKELMQMAIRVGLDSVFISDGNAKELIEESFGVVVKAVATVFGSTIGNDLQRAALQAMQLYIARNQSKVDRVSKEYRWAEAACHALYDVNVVSEEQFLEWKSDDQVSGKLAGKEQMVRETAGFFKWLDEAEED